MEPKTKREAEAAAKDAEQKATHREWWIQRQGTPTQKQEYRQEAEDLRAEAARIRTLFLTLPE